MLNIPYSSHQETSWRISALKYYFLRKFITIESRTLRWSSQHNLTAASLGTVSEIEIFDLHYYCLPSTFTGWTQVNNVLQWIQMIVPVSWKTLYISASYIYQQGITSLSSSDCKVFILILSLFPYQNTFFTFRLFCLGIFFGDYSFFYISWGLL